MNKLSLLSLNNHTWINYENMRRVCRFYDFFSLLFSAAFGSRDAWQRYFAGKLRGLGEKTRDDDLKKTSEIYSRNGQSQLKSAWNRAATELVSRNTYGKSLQVVAV